MGNTDHQSCGSFRAESCAQSVAVSRYAYLNFSKSISNRKMNIRNICQKMMEGTDGALSSLALIT